MQSVNGAQVVSPQCGTSMLSTQAGTEAVGQGTLFGRLFIFHTKLHEVANTSCLGLFIYYSIVRSTFDIKINAKMNIICLITC